MKTLSKILGSALLAWSLSLSLGACASQSNDTRTASAGCRSDRECASQGARVCVNGACQACSADAQCGAGARCANNRCERVVARVDEPNDSVAVRSQDGGRCFENVFFAFDDDRIDDGGQRSLRRAAECLAQERTTRYVLIASADPRGTSEYNLALGERRARIVQRYMISLGILPERLAVSSEGSEGATGSDEDGWRRDRRVDFRLRP